MKIQIAFLFSRRGNCYDNVFQNSFLGKSQGRTFWKIHSRNQTASETDDFWYIERALAFAAGHGE